MAARDRTQELRRPTTLKVDNNSNAGISDVSSSSNQQYYTTSAAHQYINNNDYSSAIASSYMDDDDYKDSEDDLYIVISRNIQTVRSNTQKIKRLHQRALIEIRNEQAKVYSHQIEDLIDTNANIVQTTRDKLKSYNSSSSSDPTVLEGQKKSLAKKLLDAMNEYSSVQKSAQVQIRAQLQRQYKLVNPNASRQEVANALESSSTTIFRNQILSSRVQDKPRVLQEVTNRQNDLQNIENSLLDLYNLMQDMQLLLETQQHFVNQIEAQADEAANNLAAGSTEMTKAVDNSRSARKKKWILFIILMLILVALGLYLIFTFALPAIKKDRDQKDSGPPVTVTTVVVEATPTSVASESTQNTETTVATSTATEPTAVSTNPSDGGQPQPTEGA